MAVPLQRATSVATRTFSKAPAPAGWGFDFSPMLSTLKRLWDLIGSFGTRPMMALYPDEADEILRYQARRDRLRPPHPLEGETSPARTCFFLKEFGVGAYGTNGERELYSIDTEAQTIIRLAFLAYWRGCPEHYDLDIQPKAKAASGQY
jgi:hypothetical protein